MRKTKIVCTIGPACDSEETLRAMMLAGMNVARLNFSHGTHAEHQVRIDRIKKLRAELDLPIAIMLDTKGPEYRIGTFADGKIELHSGDTFTFTTEPVTGNAERVSVSYAGLAQDLEPGNTVLVNDGLIALTVTATTDTDVICRVTAGGVLSDRKSMSFPNKVLKQTFLSEQDKSDLLFGIENDVDFVAASFVSRKQDLADLNAFLRANGGEDISVIAKIENQPGIDNIEEIFTECTGIMIARGDMGVEVPYEELPSIQKELIGKCRLLGKRVITATEMLESMTHNIRPTRAEISDVANAIYDGTSAIMLSGETAAGAYPVEALKTMSAIAERTEQEGFHLRSRTMDSNCYAAENVAAGYDTPQKVVQAWIDSPTHRKAMLGEPYQYIGIGVYYLPEDTNHYYMYWDMLLISSQEPLEGACYPDSGTATSETAAATTVTTTQTEPLSLPQIVGDVDLDGLVDMSDAVLLQKIIMGQVHVNDAQQQNKDCYADGVLDNRDVVVLLQFLVHLFPSLPVTA